MANLNLVISALQQTSTGLRPSPIQVKEVVAFVKESGVNALADLIKNYELQLDWAFVHMYLSIEVTANFFTDDKNYQEGVSYLIEALNIVLYAENEEEAEEEDTIMSTEEKVNTLSQEMAEAESALEVKNEEEDEGMNTEVKVNTLSQEMAEVESELVVGARLGFESLVPSMWGSVVDIEEVGNKLYVYTFGELYFTATLRPIKQDDEFIIHNGKLWAVDEEYKEVAV